MSEITLLDVGKLKAIAGLSWVPLAGDETSSTTAETKRQAKASGTRFGAFYANDAGRYRLVGLAPEEGGRKMVGRIPVAVWLAEAVRVPTIYIEATDDTRTRYWILSVRPGSLDPRTDVVMSDDEAIALIDEALGDALSTQTVVDLIVGGDGYSPSSHMIERAARRNARLVDLLAELPPPKAKVAQLIGVPPVVYMSVGGILVAGLVVAGGWYANKRFEVMQSEAQRAAAAAAAASEQARIQLLTEQRVEEAVTAALREDTGTPAPEEAVDGCLRLLEQYPLRMAGWNLEEISCPLAGGAPTAKYRRNTGLRGGMATQLSLHETATSAGLKVNVELMADQATLTGATLTLPSREPLTLDEMPQMQALALRLSTDLQLLGSTVNGATTQLKPPTTRTITYADPAREGGPAAMVPPHQGYRKGTVTVTGNGVWALKAVPLGQPNVSVKSITFRNAGNNLNWTLVADYVAAGT